MREVFEKYYTVRLYSCPDLHFSPTIIEIPGEYDTEEEAKKAAEPEYRKTCSYNETTGQNYSWFEVQVIEHYNKLLRYRGESPVHYKTLIAPDGKKIERYIDESRQLIFTSYATVDFMKHIGFKVVEETEDSNERNFSEPNVVER